MMADYAADPTLFPRCMQLLDEVFPGCQQMAFNGIKYQACWDQVSTPFIVEEHNKIIAHVGVWPLEILLNGKKHRTASIHGVCVKKEHRGKGLFKQLMQEALTYVNSHYESAILFTGDKTELYNSFHFKVLPQFDFMVKTQKPIVQQSDLRILKLASPNDLHLVLSLLSDHLPISNQMGFTHEKILFILNMLKDNIYYSPRLQAIIIFEIVQNNVYIKEIISKRSYPLADILSLIPEPFDKIILQFCPDKFNEYTYQPIPAKTSCYLMVSDNFKFAGEYFRYPELYVC